MKARDIIPGWPRGRSVVVPQRQPGGPWLSTGPWWADFRADERYHEKQQAMVNVWFERWRSYDRERVK